MAGAHRDRLRDVGCGLLTLVLCGCTVKRTEPIRLANERLGPMTIAVAPAINVSGSSGFDPNRVADLMAVELSYVDGVEVIPVNRVLAVLSDQGRARVASAEQALAITKVLGADAILVFAITEYDAYDPPVVGITAQLYGRRRGARRSSFDPVVESRRAAPSSQPAAGPAVAPLAQAERVFDASHEWVSKEVQRFAEARGADASPFGWRKYVVSQQDYLRFCCYATIRSLIGADRHMDATGNKTLRSP